MATYQINTAQLPPAPGPAPGDFMKYYVQESVTTELSTSR